MFNNQDEQKNINYNSIKGITCIILSAFSFSLMNLFIRLSGDLPTFQKCFFRNIVALFIAVFSIMRSKKSFRIGKGNFKYLFLRAFGGSLGLISNFYAIDHLTISDASILNKMSPFFAIVFSVFFLHEMANKFEWLSVIVAFLGAMLVVKPTFNMEAVPAMVGLFGGCAAGFAYTFVRKLGQRGENGMMIVLFFSGFSTMITLPLMLATYKPMSFTQIVFLLLTGISAAFGQIFITKAYSYAPAKEISVYDFSIVIFSAIWGFLFLNQIPDWISVVGYIIIIGTAVIKWYYTIYRHKGE